jgi:hypothetical protein
VDGSGTIVTVPFVWAVPVDDTITSFDISG